jgi:hypothetical protein
VSDDPFCSDLAREAGAPLAGTASRAELWLLLEHDGPWGADAVVDNDLPPGVREWLAAQLAALSAAGKARALLVRQERGAGAARGNGARGFLAVAREDRQELYRFSAARVEELPDLDLAARLAGGALVPAPEPLTLVCVNGRRDRCCARRGVPTYRALTEQLGDAVWQSTHQGGHRYAATGLWLPEGVAYGFLGPEDAGPLAAARPRGAIHLSRFRGRPFHPAPAQAADALVRAELGIDALDAWRLEELRREEDGAWRVTLAGAAGRVEALVEERPETVLASCSPPKEKRSERFALRSWART